jgi:hypothetical protein
LIYTLSNKRCLIILDNDKNDPETIKNEIIRKEKKYKDRIGSKSILSDNNFMFYPKNVYSIEYYLLNVNAICKAANKEGSLEVFNYIQKKIQEADRDTSNDRIAKPKDVLRNIWESLDLGAYEEVNTAVKIAECISKDDLEKNNELKELIMKMSSDTIQ